MLRTLQEADFPAAAELLSEGFPARSLGFWQAGLRTLHEHSFNAQLGFPAGWLLFDAEQPVAIALTPASLREGRDGRRETLVNVASWYVRPAYRWRAAPMLRAMLADPNAIYLDVTPNEEVSRMLVLFGLKPVNTGTVMAAVAGHAWRAASGARVRELQAGDVLPPGSPPSEQIEWHRKWGCRPLLLEQASSRSLLIYRARRVRGLPVARLKFIGSHAELHRCFGAVARHFAAQRFVFLSWDRREHTPSSVFNVVRPGGIWYARGGEFEDRTDFIGTELSLLNF